MTVPDRDGLPTLRELRRLDVVRKLVWGLMAGGGVGVLIALMPWSQGAAPLLFGFGLGLILSGIVVSETLHRCPACGAALRGRPGRACPGCGAAIN